jgi:polysaccharide biosynthesis/export protein
MGRKQLAIMKIRRSAMVAGLGLAVYLLAGFTPVCAQGVKAAPVAPSMVAAKETTSPVGSATVTKTPVNDYTVSPEDLLDVYVMDVPEVTRTYRVSSNGFLTLPLLQQPIAAAGETLDQLSALIAAKFREAGMLNNAHVTVSLKETRQHAVTVSGQVKKPQSYPIYGPTRLLDILVEAGGLAPEAGSNAIITRGDIGLRADLADNVQTGGVNPTAKGQSFTLDIHKLVETGDDKTNILLYPGDRVTVQRADLIYVMGAVTRPGGYVLNETRTQVTVLKALAMAGDVTTFAKKGRIAILRHDPAGPPERRSEIPVDYKSMVKGQIADIRLIPDDILYVPESTRVKALHQTAATALQVATYTGSSLIIYH